MVPVHSHAFQWHHKQPSNYINWSFSGAHCCCILTQMDPWISNTIKLLKLKHLELIRQLVSIKLHHIIKVKWVSHTLSSHQFFHLGHLLSQCFHLLRFEVLNQLEWLFLSFLNHVVLNILKFHFHNRYIPSNIQRLPPVLLLSAGGASIIGGLAAVGVTAVG